MLFFVWIQERSGEGLVMKQPKHVKAGLLSKLGATLVRNYFSNRPWSKIMPSKEMHSGGELRVLSNMPSYSTLYLRDHR